MIRRGDDSCSPQTELVRAHLTQPLLTQSDQQSWARAASQSDIRGTEHLPGLTIVDHKPEKSSIEPLKESLSKIKPGQTGNVSITIDGAARQFQLHVPKNYNAAKSMPLLIMFNGMSQNDKSIQTVTGLNQQADDKNFLVAYPQPKGVFGTFNNGESVFGDGHNDIKFTDDIIDSLGSNMKVNQKRVYLAGFSVGGSFAQVAAAALSKKVAAVADVEGWSTDKEATPNSPVSSLSIHGTDDLVIPSNGTVKNFFQEGSEVERLFIPGFEGDSATTPGAAHSVTSDLKNFFHNPFGSVESAAKKLVHNPIGYLQSATESPVVRPTINEVLSPVELVAGAWQLSPNGPFIEPVSHTINTWKQDDGITTGPQITNGKDTITDDFTHGKDGSEVELITLEGGEHTWPGYKGGLPILGGPNSFPATQTIVDFLLSHEK